mgnify:CR=1 FL=1
MAVVRAGAADPVEALKLVVHGGVSSRSNPNNMGLGVSHLVTQTRRRRGEMLLLSAGAVAILEPDGEVHYESAPLQFPGTAVFFRMHVDDDDD